MTISNYQSMINSLFNVPFFKKNRKVLLIFSSFFIILVLHRNQTPGDNNLSFQSISRYCHKEAASTTNLQPKTCLYQLYLDCHQSSYDLIQFNQETRFSSYFTSEVMVTHGERTFNQAELIAMERQICQLLNFKFGFTTPLQYAQPFFKSFPWLC